MHQSIEDFGDAARDVMKSRYQTFPGALKRFVATLEPATPLGGFAAIALPEVDFDDWYSQALGTSRGMTGSGQLSWPAAAPERIALQLTLFRRMASEAIGWRMFAHKFLSHSKYHDVALSALLQQVFVPFQRDFLRHLQRTIEKHAPSSAKSAPAPQPLSGPSPHGYFVDPQRIAELQELKGKRFDFSRLVRLCEELNVCHREGCHHAVAVLTRAVLDHVPPVFGTNTFTQVTANHPGGRSFKDIATFLDNSARKVADAHLHTHISKEEVLPTATQVNAAQPLDVVLAEVIRLMRGAQ